MNIEKLISIVRETDKIFFDAGLRSDVTKKGDCDFVTRADIAISEYLRRRLAEEFPTIGFMSEEGDTEMPKSCDCFILDPIDGTTNFMHGLNLSCVSLGLCSAGKITAGVIYVPYTGELFHAVAGGGAYLNGTPIRSSGNERLCDCVAFYEFNAYKKAEVSISMDFARRIFLNCQDLRCLGSSALELAYIACGKGDVFFGRSMKPWDYAAASVIIAEAGGRLGVADGEVDFTRLNSDVVAASSGAVFEELLALLDTIAP